jgi:hypothetical protein
MFKKSALIILLLLNSIRFLSQSSDKNQPLTLLYYFDDSKGDPFLLPFIESYLKELRYSNRQLDKVYSKVISLNAINENWKIEGKIIEAFTSNNQKAIWLENSKERIKTASEIANNLLNYDKFLIIKTHPLFNALLEYQFSMYDVIKQSSKNTIDLPVLKTYRSSSVFIDPKSSNYKDELIFTLKQVCSEVNEIPKAEILINKKERKLVDTIFIAIGDTVDLEALTIDPDSPPERLSYSWYLDREDFYPQLEYGKARQKITSPKIANLKISLVVNDGISASEKTEAQVSFIKRPIIELQKSGNTVFFDDFGELFKEDANNIRDDGKAKIYYDGEYLFRKTIFGRKRMIFGEDSLSIYFSEGRLRIANSTASDSVIRATFDALSFNRDTAIINEENTDTTILKKGHHVIFHLHPGGRLRVDRYYYNFYAINRGVKSGMLNVCLNFGKIRQISISNEYFFCWMGAKKGSFGNALLGINWQALSYMNISIHASIPFLPSARIHNEIREYLATKNTINSRLSLEFFNPNKLALSGFAIHIQQFAIKNQEDKVKNDYLWGVAWRQSVPFFWIGSGFEFISSFGYFPNFSKKEFVSNGGMFEMSMGGRYHFIKRKKEIR